MLFSFKEWLTVFVLISRCTFRRSRRWEWGWLGWLLMWWGAKAFWLSTVASVRPSVGRWKTTHRHIKPFTHCSCPQRIYFFLSFLSSRWHILWQGSPFMRLSGTNWTERTKVWCLSTRKSCWVHLEVCVGTVFGLLVHISFCYLTSVLSNRVCRRFHRDPGRPGECAVSLVDKLIIIKTEIMCFLKFCWYDTQFFCSLP